MTKIVCPHCEQRIAAPDEAIGMVLECPACHQTFETVWDDASVHQAPVFTPPKAAPPPPPRPPPPPPPPPPPLLVTPKASVGLGTIISWAVGLAGLAFAAYSYHQSPSRKIANDPKIREKIARSSTDVERDATPEVTPKKTIYTWEVRTVAGLKLEAPFPYKAPQDLTPTLSPDARASTEYLRLFDCDTTDMYLRAPVLRAKFVAGVEANIDDYARGAMSTVLVLTDAKPDDVTYATVDVDGFEARRASLRAVFNGGAPFHAEVMVIKKGRSFWEVKVLFPRDVDANAADRILKSIHFVDE